MFLLRLVSPRLLPSFRRINVLRQPILLRSLSQGGYQPVERTCHNCRKPGHTVADCPEPTKCHNCGEEGHKSFDCTQPRTNTRPRECFRCGATDHIAQDCQSEDRGTPRRKWNRPNRDNQEGRPSRGGFGLRNDSAPSYGSRDNQSNSTDGGGNWRREGQRSERGGFERRNASGPRFGARDEGAGGGGNWRGGYNKNAPGDSRPQRSGPRPERTFGAQPQSRGRFGLRDE